MADTVSTITISTDEFRQLLTERDHLRKQVTELQADATKTKERSLKRRVRSFHLKFGHPVNTTPHVPADDVVRFRLSLIAEEFFELLRAALAVETGHEFERAEAIIRGNINGEYPYQRALVKVDLVEFIDATIDLDYVVQGTRDVFGVDGDPALDEVHRANMSKDPVYVEAKDGTHVMGSSVKPRKPDGWTPPNIAGVLKAQGWVST